MTARAILAASVVQISDVSQDPEAADSLRTFRTVLSVPMIREGRPLGAITLGRRAVRPFTDKQIELLRTFADQALIAIENVRLFTELEARNRDLTEALEQQTATSEILRVISSSPTDVQPVFEAIVRAALRLLDGREATLWRLVDGALHAAAVANADHDGPLQALIDDYVGRGLSPWPLSRGGYMVEAIHRAIPMVMDDTEAQALLEATRERARSGGWRSALYVPMIRGGAIGVIAVARREPGGGTQDRIALLQTFADQAVIAIENARLFTELGARNAELTESLAQQTATADILRVISASPTDIAPVFDAILERATALCGAHLATLGLYESGRYRHVAHRGVSPEFAQWTLSDRSSQFRDATTGVGRMVATQKPVHIVDLTAEPAYRDRNPARVATVELGGARTFLAVPMLMEGRLVGGIVIYRPEVRAFSQRQIDLVQIFANQAVIAIENVRLFTELQTRTAQLTRSVDELTALGDVGRALSSTLDLDAVLNTIVARARQLTGSDYCAVWEYDEVGETFSVRAVESSHPEVVAAARKSVFRKGEGVQGQMAITREPVQIPDIAAGAQFVGLRDVMVRTGTRALLAVPLLRDDRLIGGLTIDKKTPGEFSSEVLDLLKTFATQSALAITNARLFREIEEQSRQLEIASQHKSQFLANMSHELRTPLNAILGYTELIVDSIYGEVPERMREVLERVDKSGRHLLGLINDILDLSKIEAGQLTLTLGPYAMDGVAQTVATQVGALAAEKQLGFETVLAEDLPIGQGDERRLTQVLLNLVGNAIKFTDVGKVVVRVGTADDAYVVSVTDTGPGIAAADREKIFEEFQQADTTRAKAKGGTGLGLAISRRIVEMHGGRLWVDSTLGEGSTFSFTVPVHVEQQAAVVRGGPRS